METSSGWIGGCPVLRSIRIAGEDTGGVTSGASGTSARGGVPDLSGLVAVTQLMVPKEVRPWRVGVWPARTTMKV